MMADATQRRPTRPEPRCTDPYWQWRDRGENR